MRSGKRGLGFRFFVVNQPSTSSSASVPGDTGPCELPLALTPPWQRNPEMPREAVMRLPDGRRFAALSSLPENQRLPTRRDVPTPRHQRQEVALPPASADVLPALLPAPSLRQMGFNCPSCFTVLVIKDPVNYDGSAAPCPTCGIRIQPPRRMPDSPFSIVRRVGPEG